MILSVAILSIDKLWDVYFDFNDQNIFYDIRLIIQKHEHNVVVEIVFNDFHAR